jgi:hypothetical protein
LSSDSNTHEYSRALIRTIALLRSATFPFGVYNFASSKDFIVHETTVHRYVLSKWDYPPLKLPFNTSTVAFREVLGTNQKVKRLTFECLQFYFVKFKSLRPSHLDNKDFRYDNKCGLDDPGYVAPWQHEPLQIPYPIQEVGVPSWLEQQRVIRALWRIRLLYEFKDAIGTSCVLWTAEDVAKLCSMTLVELYNQGHIQSH